MHKRLTAYFLLSLNALLWGAAFVIVKPAFEVTTPHRFLLYRFAIASLLSVPLFFWYLPAIKKPVQAVKRVFGLELLGTTLALALLYTGLNYTSALEANLLATTQPIFITIGGIWLLRERQDRHEWFGLLLAFVGALILTFEPVIHGGGWSNQVAIIGNLLIIASLVANLFYFPLAKKNYKKLPKLWVASVSFYLGLITFFILSLSEVQWSLTALLSAISLDLQHIPVWIASGYMGIFGSLIALTAYIKGQDLVEASEASLFWYLQPLVYVPLSWLVLGEKIGLIQLISLIFILLGVVIAEKRKPVI